MELHLPMAKQHKSSRNPSERRLCTGSWQTLWRLQPGGLRSSCEEVWGEFVSPLSELLAGDNVNVALRCIAQVRDSGK